ncbi:pseudouridine synthase [Rubrivirga sp.]|uniref:pseudouridine synthase n=1 Tax=Rubrivirga sp. TaxID=1885344 RepID=UPI003C773382
MSKGRAGGDASIRRRHQAERKQRASHNEPPGEDTGPIRLNKFLARAGVGSRREADTIIASGRVTVNGEVSAEMGVRVSDADRVEVDGKPVQPTDLAYILLNKPTDAITTVTDDRGRKTVMDLVSIPGRIKSALFPVGRLDRNTTGALLLTTDGDLAHRLMHPSYGAVKTYIVTADAPFDPSDLDKLLNGVDLEDGPARADHAFFPDSDRRSIALQLHEGRNRQVRRMTRALGRRVVSLERVAYAGLTLDGLKRGRWRRLEEHEVNTLRRSVKLKHILY